MSLQVKSIFCIYLALYLVLNLCYLSAAQQDLYHLSYGSDVLPQMTPHPPTTTTKSGFFKGIKNWFKGGSSSTTPSSSINVVDGSVKPQSNPLPTSNTPNQVPSPSSPNQNPQSSGTSINTNVRQGNPPTGSLPIAPPGNVNPTPLTPTGSYQGSVPLSGNSGNRDFINPNVHPGNSPTPGIKPPPNSSPILPGTPTSTYRPNGGMSIQLPNNRDFVNPNVKPGNLPPSNPSPSSPVINPTYPNINPQTPTNNRDYVNPNAKPIGTPLSPFPTGGQGQPQGTIPQSPKRDYVNPNIGTQGGGTTSNPISSNLPYIPSPTTSPTTGRRDFVNSTPRGPQPQSPSINNQPISPMSPMSQPINPTNPWNNIPPSQSGGGGGSGSDSNRRDFVNPNIKPNRQQPNNDDFPPLPTPKRPGGPPQQQQQPGTNPSNNPTGGGVSFIPRPPSPGSGRQPSTTPKSNTELLATDDEITALTETLYTKDTNNQNRHIVINYQGRTRSSETTDEAAEPLLQVNEQALESPTIAKLRPLFNNYELDTSVNEHVTPLERKEENELLDVILATSVMRQAMLFLQNKGIVTPDPRTHRELLKTIWFSLYSRGGGRIGSSSFEHVFLSEIKNGTVTGLHNWVYYFEEERQGHIDYKGYIKKLELGNKGAVVKFRFNFNGIEKPVNSMFIGTSPELEMALYTVCFEVRPNKDCPVSLGGNKFTIQTYTFRYRGKNLIGSAFPEI